MLKHSAVIEPFNVRPTVERASTLLTTLHGLALWLETVEFHSTDRTRDSTDRTRDLLSLNSTTFGLFLAQIYGAFDYSEGESLCNMSIT